VKKVEAQNEDVKEPTTQKLMKRGVIAVEFSFGVCTLPTTPVSRSFGLRSSYEIDILDTDQRSRKIMLTKEGVLGKS